eukprot:TRINITY_DN8412_c0_g1_i4.p1 TRINITY_DN8412_c0_g1~~TRINITY_DN8412_c0_g1_i4.p1  ORF type:complete len:307 (+),score=23.08 TRINITY_DN8412_c0_g1_i4:53-922(+)
MRPRGYTGMTEQDEECISIDAPVPVSRSSGHPKCMPCHGTRLLTSPMVGVVMGLIALTYVPYVIMNTRNDLPAQVCRVIFHILLGLLIGSYLQTVFVDAGTPPDWWQVEAAQNPNSPVCQKSGLFKPPRSHYDSITKRLVLNMDHFCPWVANTVGFYNRKYFVLFLIYAALTCTFAAVTIVVFFRDQTFPTVGCRKAKTCPSSIMLFALIFDAIFGLLLLCFAGVHIHMVLQNQTTIESDGVHFNVGMRKNWEQVFGTQPIFWFLPVWGGGPDGDGVTWPAQTQPAHNC